MIAGGNLPKKSSCTVYTSQFAVCEFPKKNRSNFTPARAKQQTKEKNMTNEDIINEENKAPAVVKSQVMVGTNGLQLASLDDMWRFATCVVKSGFAPKGMEKAESVLIALEMGFEVGLPPMASLQNIAVVNGRPAIWGDAQAAVCLRSGLVDGGIEDEYTGTPLKDDWTCEVSVRRKGVAKAFKGSFSYGEARTADLLGRDTWKKYPRKMLLARARSEALRKAFPDILKGIKCAEEMEGVVDNITAPELPKSSLFGKKKPAKIEVETTAEVVEDSLPETEKPAEVVEESAPKVEKTAKDVLAEKLAEAGLTESQLLDYASRNKLLVKGEIDESTAKKILNAWYSVKELIAMSKAE